MEWLIASALAGGVGGIVLADSVRVPEAAPASLVPWLAAAAVVAGAGLWIGRRAPWPWIMVVCALLGFGVHLARGAPTIDLQDEAEVEVVGEVVAGARPRPDGWSCVLRADRCDAVPCDARVLLRGTGPPPATGARIRAAGRFLAWRPAAAAYLFDGRRYGDIHGLAGALRVVQIQSAPARGGLDAWRVAREASARAALGDGDVAMVLAIVTGSRGLADRARRGPINDAGLGHLLAISGLHLMTVGGLVVWLMGLLTRVLPSLLRTAAGRGLLWIVPLATVFAYATLCGWPISAQRAAAMFVVWRLATLLRRPAAAVPAVASAVAVGLWVQGTQAIFDPGLQLSVAAVCGIVLALRGTSDPRLGVRLLRVPLIVTLASTAATAPLTLLHFGRLPLVGGLLNLLAVPVVQFISLPVGLAGFAAPAPLGDPLLWLSARSLQLVEWLAVNCPHSGMVAGIGQPGWLAAGLPLAGLLAVSSRPRTALVVVFACSLLAAGPAPGGFVFVPVGQGDAILMMDGEGSAVLVDAGGDADRDVGTGVVLPALARAGARLRVVLVTHPDADHVAGLASVVRATSPDQVWIAEAFRSAPEVRALLAAAEDVGAAVREPPMHARMGPLTLRRIPGLAHGSDNDRSVVYEAQLHGLRVLLTGDVEVEGERTAARGTRAVHVLKVAHHGSRTSSTPVLLRAARPRLGIISSGRDNRFGHPHEAALERLRAHHVPSWSTADCGHIEARAQNGRLVVQSHSACAGFGTARSP